MHVHVWKLVQILVDIPWIIGTASIFTFWNQQSCTELNNRTCQQPPPHSSVKLACSSKHNSVVDGSQPSVVTKSPAVSHRPASVLQGPPLPCNAALGAVIVNSVLSNSEKQRRCHLGISWYRANPRKSDIVYQDCKMSQIEWGCIMSTIIGVSLSGNFICLSIFLHLYHSWQRWCLLMSTIMMTPCFSGFKALNASWHLSPTDRSPHLAYQSGYSPPADTATAPMKKERNEAAVVWYRTSANCQVLHSASTLKAIHIHCPHNYVRFIGFRLAIPIEGESDSAWTGLELAEITRTDLVHVESLEANVHTSWTFLGAISYRWCVLGPELEEPHISHNSHNHNKRADNVHHMSVLPDYLPT